MQSAAGKCLVQATKKEYHSTASSLATLPTSLATITYISLATITYVSLATITYVRMAKSAMVIILVQLLI